MQSFLEHWRVPYLLVLGGLTLFFGFHCLHLHVDEDNRSMDADDKGQARIEDKFVKVFGESDSILIAVHRDTDLLDESGEKLIREISDDVSDLDGVKKVTSLVESHFSVPEYLDGLLISKDRKTAGISVLLDEFSDKGKSLNRVAEEIRSIAADHSKGDQKVAVTGLPLQKLEAGRLVRRDQKIFAPLSFLILGTLLLLITRHWSGMFFPLLVSALTICWTLGIYSLLGYSLNMITSLLAPVIMTLSATTTIHIYLEWLVGRESDNRSRIIGAVKNLYRPCLFASLTTAIGFLSLLLSRTPAVREFGFFAALGVLISYALGVSGLAVCLSFFKSPPPHDPGEDHDFGHRFLSPILTRLSLISIGHPRKIIIGSLLIALVSCYGVRKVRTNTDLLRYLGTGSRLYKDTIFIDRNLTGVNTVELLISKSDGQEVIDNFADLEKIEAFQKAVTAIPLVRHSLSAADLLGTEEVMKYKGMVPFRKIVEEVSPTEFLSRDLKTARVSIRTGVIGTFAGAGLVDDIRMIARKKLGDQYTVSEVGGFYRVISESTRLVATQIKSFGIAVILILIAIGVVFRSVGFMGLALIPNVIPLLMTAGIMGFFQIDLSTGTAMIASVVIGVAVDDTIHYLAAFRRTYRGQCDRSIKRTTGFTGFALISTTLALATGFWVAIFGSFQPTVYFALLSGLTMWFALACDLLVLPACLKLLFSRIEK